MVCSVMESCNIRIFVGKINFHTLVLTEKDKPVFREDTIFLIFCIL